MEGCDPGCLSHYILLLLSHFGDSTDISTKGWKSERERERVPYLCLAAFIRGIIRTTLAAFRINQYKFLVHTNAYVEDNNGVYLSVPVLTNPGWKSLDFPIVIIWNSLRLWSLCCTDITLYSLTYHNNLWSFQIMFSWEFRFKTLQKR